jgi:autotransporter-associated beta strand protein
VIGGSGTLLKSGAGTLSLTGNNTYSGGTTVNAGTLLANNATASTGSGAVTVNGSGTTLGGTGTITGAVTLGNTTPGAILNPGPKGTAGTAASVGTLTTGALTLTGANTVHIDAFGTGTSQWDKLVSTAAISLGATSTLDVTIASGLTFTANTTYVLLSGTSLTGTFAGIVDGQIYSFSGYAFTADYTATGFDLVAVPEPGTWIGGSLALATLAFSQRRRLKPLLVES